MQPQRTSFLPVLLALAGLAPGLIGQTGEAVPISAGAAPDPGVPVVEGADLVGGSPMLWDLVFSRARFDARLPDQFELSVLDVILADTAYGGLAVVRSHVSSGTPGQTGSEGAPPEVLGQSIFLPREGPGGMSPDEGSLVWSGRVFAVPSDPDASGELPVVGDVTVQVVGGPDPTLGVSFSNLVSLADGSMREPITWSDVALLDGAFGSGDAPESRISGLFLGDGQEELGGLFQWQGLSGAFSASRGEVPGDGRDEGPPSAGGEIAALLEFVLFGPNFGLPTAGIDPPPMSGGSPPAGDGSPVLAGVATSLQLVGYTDGMGRQTGRFVSSSLTSFGEGVEDGLLELVDVGETRGFAHGDGYGNFGANTTSVIFPVSVLIPEAEGTLPADPSLENVVQASWGMSTITQPTRGIGTWLGDMVATDISQSATRGNLVQGEAMVQVDLDGDPMVDVEFTRVRDIDAGLARRDIAWNGLPLVAGVFGSEAEGFLRGSFVGENHEGVLGIFERDDISGGFSATSVPAGQMGTAEVPERVVHIVAAASTSVVGREGERALVAAVEELIGSMSPPEAPLGQVSEYSFLGAMIGSSLTDIHAFAGWLEGGFFSVASVYPEGGGEEPRDAPIASVALLSGTASHSTPSDVSASWHGPVLATDGREGPTGGGILRGEALITLEQDAYVAANVRFTGIAGSGGSPRPDMNWIGIPVNDGQFRSSTDQDWIHGHFLGADHSGVGGSFDWLGLRGVFGATKTLP